MKNSLIEIINAINILRDSILNENDLSEITTDMEEKAEFVEKLKRIQASAELFRMKEIIAKVENPDRSDKLW